MIRRLSSCCFCMHYITWRGSLSVSDKIMLTLLSKWATSISWRSERKPRSVLLCSQRMTFIPWEAVSRISWWDISPANKGKSKYLNIRQSMEWWTITTQGLNLHSVWSKCNAAVIYKSLYLNLESHGEVSDMLCILKRQRLLHREFQIFLGRPKTSIQTCISNSF